MGAEAKSCVIGAVTLGDCRPMSRDEFEAAASSHLAHDFAPVQKWLDSGSLHATELHDAVRFETPIPYQQKKGARKWIGYQPLVTLLAEQRRAMLRRLDAVHRRIKRWRQRIRHCQSVSTLQQTEKPLQQLETALQAVHDEASYPSSEEGDDEGGEEGGGGAGDPGRAERQKKRGRRIVESDDEGDGGGVDVEGESGEESSGVEGGGKPDGEEGGEIRSSSRHPADAYCLAMPEERRVAEETAGGIFVDPVTKERNLLISPYTAAEKAVMRRETGDGASKSEVEAARARMEAHAAESEVEEEAGEEAEAMEEEDGSGVNIDGESGGGAEDGEVASQGEADGEVADGDAMAVEGNGDGGGDEGGGGGGGGEVSGEPCGDSGDERGGEDEAESNAGGEMNGAEASSDAQGEADGEVADGDKMEVEGDSDGGGEVAEREGGEASSEPDGEGGDENDGQDEAGDRAEGGGEGDVGGGNDATTLTAGTVSGVAPAAAETATHAASYPGDVAGDEATFAMAAFERLEADRTQEEATRTGGLNGGDLVAGESAHALNLAAAQRRAARGEEPATGIEVGSEVGGGDEEGEETQGEPEWRPQNEEELLDAIVEKDYGVSDDRSSALTAPALKAYNNALKSAYGHYELRRGRTLPEGFVIVKVTADMHMPSSSVRPAPCTLISRTDQINMCVPQCPLKGELAPRMHLVDALTRMRLLTSGLGCCVPFTHRKTRMTLLKGEAALAARREVASKLREAPRALSALRRQELNVDKPDFELMQLLFDAGVSQCPLSGMPIFDPSKCAPNLRTALWKGLCSVAKTVNTTELGQVDEALDELREKLHEHAGEGHAAKGHKRRCRTFDSDDEVTDTGESNKRVRPHRIADNDKDDAM